MPADTLAGTDDNSLDDFALLGSAARGSLANAGYDNVTNIAISVNRAAEHANALQFLSAGVIGNLQYCFLLYHGDPPYLALVTISTTRHLLSLDRGRVSITRTVSPTLHSLFSSCALSL